MEERLDRFCANTEWSLLFPDMQVTHVDSDYSDHLPILLNCCLNDRGTRCNRKKFRFENMWATSEDCKGVIERAWEAVSVGEDVDNLLVRIS